MKYFCWRVCGWAVLAVVLCGATGCSSKSTATVPTPILTNLFPSNITAGSQSFKLFITGNDFISGKQGVTFAYWNGSARSTTLDVQTGELSVLILPSDVAAAGIAAVTVANPPPGGSCDAQGGNCGLNTFTIVQPQPTDPTIVVPPAGTSFSPASAAVGKPGFTLTINGTNFLSGDVVLVDGTQRAATVVSPTQITVALTDTDVSTQGFLGIVVSRPNRINASPSVNFPVVGPSTPVPGVNSITPSSIASGSADFQLTVTGSGFAANAFVNWNGSPRGTAFISGSQLVALISAADVAAAGNNSVTVTNPTTAATPGGGTSPSTTFTVSH